MQLLSMFMDNFLSSTDFSGTYFQVNMFTIWAEKSRKLFQLFVEEKQLVWGNHMMQQINSVGKVLVFWLARRKYLLFQ